MLPVLRKTVPRETRRALATAEDAVTATVLGMLQYLPWEKGLGPLIERVGIGETEPGKLHFWPRHSGVEPDLFLMGDDWAVLLEAKVGADFGEQQLGREWRLLRKLGEGRRLRLVTITPDELPRETVRALAIADLEALGDDSPTPEPAQIHSLRWHDLLPSTAGLAEHELVLHADLVAYLRVAGLLRRPFASWAGLEPPALPATAIWYRSAPATGQTSWFDLEPPSLPPLSTWYATP
jgi:hypothetical protein